MRQLTDHIVSGDQAVQLEIFVLDEPGAGGANHQYMISFGKKIDDNPEVREFVTRLMRNQVYANIQSEVSLGSTCFIGFQDGPIKEAGVNGITQEALLTVIIDRLRSFQSGPFSCRENAIALTHCEDALMWLQKRTVARIKRGVEGTNQK